MKTETRPLLLLIPGTVYLTLGPRKKGKGERAGYELRVAG